MMIEIWVPGIPAPGGSKSRIVINGHATMAPASKKTKPWMALVAAFAQDAYRGPALEGPLQVEMHFRFPRPKKHFHTGKKNAGKLRSDAPIFHITTPDLTKVIRSTEDALTGIVWRDDKQVAVRVATKTYADRPGVVVRVWPAIMGALSSETHSRKPLEMIGDTF